MIEISSDSESTSDNFENGLQAKFENDYESSFEYNFEDIPKNYVKNENVKNILIIK